MTVRFGLSLSPALISSTATGWPPWPSTQA